MLTDEEVNNLLEQAQESEDDAPRVALIDAFKPLIESCCSVRKRPLTFHRDDARQIANIAFLRAIRTYKFGKSKFASWARSHMIWDLFAEANRTLVDPSRTKGFRKTIRDINLARSIVVECGGSPSDTGDIAALIGVPEHELLAIVATREAPDDLVDFYGEDYLTDGTDPEFEITREMDRNKLLAVMRDVLTERERDILLRFADGVPFATIGREIGLSRERVRQIHDEAFNTVQSAMGFRNRRAA